MRRPFQLTSSLRQAQQELSTIPDVLHDFCGQQVIISSPVRKVGNQAEIDGMYVPLKDRFRNFIVESMRFTGNPAQPAAPNDPKFYSHEPCDYILH